MSVGTIIRCSMLSAWPDCERRAAARQWRAEIVAAGYALRSIPSSVGAAVGTAVHAAAVGALRRRMETGSYGSFDDGMGAAIEAFDSEVQQGAVWDATTPTPAVAGAQIRRLLAVYLLEVAPGIEPAAVEMEWRADLGDGFALSGHCDVLTREGVIRDLKTGVRMRPHQAQLGGYALLARSQRPPVEVSGLVIDFIRRTPRTCPQDQPVSEACDQEVAERAAFSVVGRVRSAVSEFRRRLAADGEPPEEAFQANPMSMMCRPQYCPAHGTDFCQLGRKES